MEKEQDEYQRELEEQERDLKALLNGAKVVAAHSLKASGQAYKEALASNKDPIKACKELTKGGAHIHGRMGLDAMKTVMQTYDQLYQNKVMSEYFQNQNQDQNQDQDTLDDL